MPWTVVPSSDEAALLTEAGIIYRDSRRYQQAREVFLGLRALFPASEAGEMGLGSVALAQGDVEGAMAHFRKATEVNPRSAAAWAHLAQASVFNRDKDSAYQYCRKALELDPRGDAARFARSVIEYADAVEYK